ncbi:hypothetical protein [Flavobacterium sp.]|uniref:hypothetical protein n=1 Tax=Flavobacterium sp. TaxID=239 RepID=UPI00261F70E2|nr:hypothetical protein [Flavobacterium sp.]MDD3005157.1 hypothetical protein [Flavobacterium sp.]
MELEIFIMIVIFGLIAYTYFQRRPPLQDTGRDYYYKRFMRNKEQLNKYITDLENINNAFPDAKLIVASDVDKSVQDYLKEMKDYLETEFPEKKLKTIKKKKLTYKEKNIFTKKLCDQSEKLFKIEVDIASFLEKEKRLTIL